jgi:hypothetical protein
MIRNLFCSLVVALGLGSSLGLAQEIVPANHGGPVVFAGNSCEGGSCGRCPDCVRVPDVVKHTEVLYCTKCRDICLPKCSLRGILSGHCGSCGGCDSGECSDCTKYHTHRLMKRVCVTECPTTKCVPACEAGNVVTAPAVLVPAPAPNPAPAKLPTR